MAEGSSGSGLGTFLAVMTALFTVAVIAVLVSQNAQTSTVISALASGTGTVLNAATAPVTGSSGAGSVVGANAPATTPH